MTITASPSATAVPAPSDLAPIVVDLYRDIHKGIRAELFAATLDAGRADPADDAGRTALDAQVNDLVRFLGQHAEHEDGAIQPVLEIELPDLAERVAREHVGLEGRMVRLAEIAQVARVAPDHHQRLRVHQLHVELAAFTSEYLAHQDLEERVVMPALEQAVGAEAVVAIHAAIVGPMPPEELMASLAVMVPAMNVEDRVELLTGMRESAPPEAFEAVLGLVRSVLEPAGARAVSRRLGVA
ncbi:hemerythrin domain-containing protein [Rhabdothermincola salaria]|uniref:hemerythrin domain-containing protein n=1 Tax=Rhabdothermincola salaria TaxID=2903142 RepID=UPI001E3C32EE|nr:hemerythrin domain-containing protein [Rhabdothermincola salaria]MCD9625703.1 hemerythrin domain-containing protein [Rhabdothermincola salaria]